MLAVSALRIAYLAWFCPYTLVEDEAHYWEWSRHLDWSYYSKGPGIAWSIAAFARFFGDSELAVRLPAVVFAAVFSLGVAGLARSASRDSRAGFFAAVLTLLVPFHQAGGVLLTIDMPCLAFWALACWAGWLALERGSRRAWLALGAAIGAGFLFKYTILLLPPGIALYALLRRSRLGVAAGWRSWALGGLLVALVGLAPVLVWNALHGWPTVRHLLGHLGIAGGDVAVTQGGRAWRYDPRWTLELLGAQVALMGVPIVLMVIAVVGALRTRRADAWPARLYLVLCAAPILVFYLGVTFVTEPEGNWPVAGYTSLLALAGWAVADALAIPRPRARSHTRALFAVSVFAGALIAIAGLRLDLIARVVNPVIERWHARWPALRPIPLGRAIGAREIAKEARALADELERTTGREPFFIAQHYGRASQLAFYLPGRPIVYCSSAMSGGRKTQYDFWADTDLSRLDRLGGRPAVLIGGARPQWASAFDSVTDCGRLPSETKKDRLTFVGSGYRGFPADGGRP